jgi:hypothetical protein
MIVKLRFGCPECPPDQVETGEFNETFVWIDDDETMLQRLVRRLRRAPKPRHREARRTPRMKEVYRERPVELSFSVKGDKKSPFTCSRCGTRYNYVELFRADGTTMWQWSHTYRPGDTYVKMYVVEDCQDCGGHLTRYSLSVTGVDREDCRNCAAGAIDSDLSGQHGSWRKP